MRGRLKENIRNHSLRLPFAVAGRKICYGDTNIELAAELTYANFGQDHAVDHTSGDMGIIWIILTIVMLLIPKTRKSGVIMAAALIVDVILCNVILKNLIARVRPYDVNTAVQVLVAKPKDFSFPSGHTAASFASVTALYLAGEKKLWKPALALAILIAFSRMYLYVHYPTDILGGVIFGSLSAWIGYRISTKVLLYAMMKKE